MTRPTVGVIDYEIGNLKSIANAIVELGGEPVVSSEKDVLRGCDRLILPGVGAFPHGMQALRQAGLVHFLQDVVESGTPLLGICLGMQLLMEQSAEFGDTTGLALLSGKVDRLASGRGESTLRLPNVGWLQLKRKRDFCTPIVEQMFDGVGEHARFYFIHSYAASPDAPAVAATSAYEGVEFASVVARDNIVGTQFHPEKSGPAGLQLLKNFIS